MTEPTAPLAARMRPVNFDEFAGQPHLVAPGAAFRRAVEGDRLGSVILWGPPGVGKTTLAEIVANQTRKYFERVSAVSAGVADLRKVVEQAKLRRNPPAPTKLFEQAFEAQATVLFIDEIHRFNKSQQDAILPFVEDGTLTLIGATTENPSFEVNSALLSRSRVYVLNALEDEEIIAVVRRALEDPRGLNGSVEIDEDALAAIANLANGDARSSLNMLELCSGVASINPTPSGEGGRGEEESGKPRITLETVTSAIQQRTVYYDKGGEQHYDLISALHKCVRGSDADGALYWLARMLERGEDPMYLARRIVRMANEDIGLAEPRAMQLAISAQQTLHFVGMPEGALALAQAVVYLALCPKSNALYTAYKAAVADVHETRNDPVPIHLRNAPTKLMKGLGYGEGYKYAHDYEEGIVAQQNRPESVDGHVYYQPTNRGAEAKLAERLAEIRRIYEA